MLDSKVQRFPDGPSVDSHGILPKLDPLDKALGNASPERKSIFEVLKGREWFKNTATALKVELATLPGEPKNCFDGFLRDLAVRPTVISNVTVKSLAKLARGNFAIIPIFNVENEAGQKYTYEYMSWRYGPFSGVKGLVLFETNGKPTHFALLTGEKFATGRRETEVIGGFLDLNVDGVKSAVDRIKTEIHQEFGVPNIKLARDPIDLGRLTIDPGMTNNRPGIFVASVDVSESVRIPPNPVNLDPYELRGKVNILPLSALQEFVMKSEDSYFLSCVAKAWAKGIIPFEESHE